jgi:predicted Zn-dependent protease
MLRYQSPAILAIILVICSGCQSNPITGRSQFMIVSEKEAESSSAQAYASLLTEARAKGKLDTDSARQQRVRRITDRLVAQAQILRPESRNWQWSVHVIDDPAVNAWCMPGGKMAVYTGLLQKLHPSDDELAQVLGHEISHALLSHGREKMSRAMATDVGLQAGSILAGRDLTPLSSVAEVALLLPNSREAEAEADTLGIELAAKAGYDPQAAVTLWQKMSTLGGSHPPQFLSTHPSNEARLANLAKLVPQMMPYYQQAKSKNG